MAHCVACAGVQELSLHLTMATQDAQRNCYRCGDNWSPAAQEQFWFQNFGGTFLPLRMVVSTQARCRFEAVVLTFDLVPPASQYDVWKCFKSPVLVFKNTYEDRKLLSNCLKLFPWLCRGFVSDSLRGFPFMFLIWHSLFASWEMGKPFSLHSAGKRVPWKYFR